MNIQAGVLQRYSEGAKQREAELCCPVSYDAALLAELPAEIIDKDYGCGDPSRYVRHGDHVLDLGSGGGKICYMAAHLAGHRGAITGVDMNDDMLGLARKYQAEMAAKPGYAPVRFLKGFIQDLALDGAALERYLTERPVRDIADLIALEAWKERQRRESPMIPDHTMDLVISNCVLNLVPNEHKPQLIQEVFRVLKPGGRVAISDIICDREVPERLRRDPVLWSGCISGAFHETAFLEAFRQAGFVGAMYDKWEEQPWRVVEGIVFRSVTLVAHKPPATSAAGEVAVLYRGPFAEVRDEEGRVYPAGVRVTVPASVGQRLTASAMGDAMIIISPEKEHALPGIQAASCCGPACC